MKSFLELLILMKIDPKKHMILIEDVLTKAGLPETHAKAASKIMYYADIRGLDSHGLILLQTYIDRINNNIINKSPNFLWEEKSEIISVLDGDKGIGHFVGDMAMKEAIKIAKEKSLGLVFVKNATHYGASGYYTELAASHGMIGFTTTNTMPLMAPTGGIERIIGNNPISLSVPRRGKEPIILDMAISVAAAGRIILANQKNEKIPLGWALNKDGDPTTDAYEGFEGGGTLLPIANYKGYGLAFFMDILSGVLTGSGYSKYVGHSDIGFVFMAIDIEKIMPSQLFNQRLEDYISIIKNSRKLNDEASIFLPGEIEYSKKKEREQSGIVINDKLYMELEQLTLHLNISLEEYLL
jgi:LDH2 family malate/lactate/ureidoglycolate dehydrogenase